MGILTPASSVQAMSTTSNPIKASWIIRRVPSECDKECDVSRDLYHTFHRIFWNQNDRGDALHSIHCIRLGIASGNTIDEGHAMSAAQCAKHGPGTVRTRESWQTFLARQSERG